MDPCGCAAGPGQVQPDGGSGRAHGGEWWLHAGYKAAAVHGSAQKTKRAPSKSSKTKAAAALASADDEMAELQGMLERLRLEKEKAEDMVQERVEVIRKEEIETREKEEGPLQAELRKVQRAKEFMPTPPGRAQEGAARQGVHAHRELPRCQVAARERPGRRQGKKKGKGKGKDGHERKKLCPAYALWLKDQWNEIKKNPEDDFKEESNALGAKWNALGAEEKQSCEERYRQEKEAYLQVVGPERRDAEAMKA